MPLIRRDERGFVLVVVLVALVLLLALVTGVMSFAVGQRDLSARDQDWNAALAAAEAGIDDYLFRLNQDDSYWQYSATDPPPDGNQAFTTWVPVPGPATSSWFRYDVDTSQLAVDGTVRLTSTGRVGDVTRTLQASLRRRNFLDFLYFTDFETKDPAAYGTGDAYTPAQAQTYCALHYYEGRDVAGRVDFPGDTDGPICTEIYFISQDTINGPMHTNDAIRVSGSPTFNGDTSTSYDPATPPRWIGTGTPNFAVPGDPVYADPLTMPPSNVEIKQETDPALGGTGCLFTGPTAIRLNSTGTMDVISPFSKAINCTPTTITPDANLNSTAPFAITRMSLPENGVVYVQNVPSNPSDPNYTNACPYNQEAIGGLSTYGASSNPNRAHPLGFPHRYDTTTYNCRSGDVFIQGTLDGRLTIAADNNVILFGSITYAGGAGGDDLLGLVANNYVEVHHPVATSGSAPCDGGYVGPGSDDRCNLRLPGLSGATTPSLFSGTTPGSSTMATYTTTRALRSPDFYGPLLTLQHSFRVQNYQYGQGSVLADLTVYGAIAQKFRGPVGTFSGSTIVSGYQKNYIYDQRLKYDSPPKYLNPVASAWQVVTWAERPAAYAPDAP